MKKISLFLACILMVALSVYFMADRDVQAQRSWYTSLTTKSTTLNDLHPGGATGQIREELGKQYMLVKAAGTIADGALFKKDATTSAIVTVIATIDTNCVALGVNNIGAAVTTGYFFWGLIKGIGYGLDDGTGWNDGDALGPSATDGNIGAQNVTQAADQLVGVAIADDDTTATNVIWFDF